MHIAPVQRVLGILLMLFSLTMLPPVVVSWIYGGPGTVAFIESAIIIIVLGFVCWAPVAGTRRDLRLRDGFMIAALFWTVLGLAGALPLILSDAIRIDFTDAAFEAVSGLTTTGSTVIVGLDTLPHSILFFRQELQWLGGMGIIVLAVAVLPMLGVGGMQLYRAETPGPIKDNKLTPRIADTAKVLWLLYVGLTGLCAYAYWVAGMSGFDAISHAFSTVATAGFSTHDASFGYFDSPGLEMIAVVFMILGGTSYALHFAALRLRSLSPYAQDAECRTYLSVLLAVAAITIGYLVLTQHFGALHPALHHGLFQVVSITTSTGYTTADFAGWPLFLPVLLIFASFMGGSAGSTAGGMKVIRILLLFKQGVRELTRLMHPSARVAVKVGGRAVNDRVIQGVWGFFAAYVLCFSVGMLLLMASGLDQVTAFSAMAACINNLGPGLGDVAANFRTVGDFGKWVLIVAMLLGRLEIFPLLVLLTPDFWRG